MLKRDKNRLLAAIKRYGLKPEDFEGREQMLYGAPSFSVTYRNSPFRFVTHVSEDDYSSFTIRRTLLGPGWPLSDWEPDSGFVYSMDQVETRFLEWLGKLEQYIEEQVTPNRWEEIQSSQEKVDQVLLGPEETNDEFSDSEKRVIEDSIKKFRHWIAANYPGSEEQLALVDSKLDYLIEATHRLGRIDWRNVFIATVLAIIVSLHLDTAAGNALYRFIAEALANGLRLLQ